MFYGKFYLLCAFVILSSFGFSQSGSGATVSVSIITDEAAIFQTAEPVQEGVSNSINVAKYVDKKHTSKIILTAFGVAGSTFEYSISIPSEPVQLYTNKAGDAFTAHGLKLFQETCGTQKIYLLSASVEICPVIQTGVIYPGSPVSITVNYN